MSVFSFLVFRKMKKITILASGSGTNAENIHEFFARGNRVGVAAVIYDREGAGVAERMAKHGVETIYIPGREWRENPEKILDTLRTLDTDLVVLAGFLRHVPDCITEAYRGRILNIHPSLLPAYGGKGMYGHKVHEAVISAGESRSGVTVHYVNSEYDGGEILMQEEVEITPEDTAETLEAKIHAVEYALYPRAIVKALANMLESEPHTEEQDTAGSEPPASQTPPPVPPAKEWADALGVAYRPELLPPEPGQPRYSAAPQPEGAEPRQESYGSRPQPQFQSRQMSRGSRPGDEPMPPTHLVWAVIVTVCCCFIPGIVAIVMSSRVSSRYYAGDMEGAKRASKACEWWIIASFILGVLSATLYLPLSIFSV